MLPEQTLSRFLLLPELKLTHVIPVSRSGGIYNAEKVSDFEVCPKCASKCDKIYDRRWITVRDEPIRGKYVILKIRKRRFFCKKCQKPFTEPISGVRGRGQQKDFAVLCCGLLRTSST
ncbi:transposase family protein [Pseudobacteriovorax antillogorgiicola]|uniref:Zinc-finger of transposase IS204/IS1001/IS1096/IS1165 n=1 Tax=Pseudobacteriovorax antillogorgiicola TaxID=1513793 RepID=A0A1Y6CRA5_9BACT|nr:transposase IS204/IS1001/IS1096/IS1165 family protein [Pseudobacteriovorax antillogorgiicola]SMF83889.1 zinc-finger of transposase IS204/IS1001/IS1096/IS1165 [Pseudobacteriovorax antillogorgiicola]